MMTFSADGSRLAVATTLGVWVIDMSSRGAPPCAPTSNLNPQCLLEGQNGVESVTFSPDGSMIAAGGDDHSVTIFDAMTGKTIAQLTNHIYPISAVAWSSDGKWVASGDWSGVVRLWDTSTWSEFRTFSINGKITGLNFNLALGVLTATADDGDNWQCSNWDIVSGASASPMPCPATIATLSNILTTSQEDQETEYQADSGQIQISDKNTQIAALDGFYGELGEVFFTSDGRVGAHPIAQPILFSLSSGQSDNSPIPVISPDGSRKATFGNDGVIRLFDTKTGNLIAQLHGHIRAINAVAFSPDGKLLASASNDDTIQLWDATVTQDSGALFVLHDLNGGVSSVAFNSDGTLLASAGYDGTIRLWGIKTG